MSHISNRSTITTSHWLLALLCFLPLAGLAAVFVFNLSIASVLLVALVLACPIIHLFIMGMGQDGHSSHKHNPEPSRCGAANHKKG